MANGLNVCRFNPEHQYNNPVALRRHYELDHAHEWEPPANPKVRCTVDGCGKVTVQSNMYSHLKREHGNRTIKGAYVEVDPSTPITPREYKKPTNGHDVANATTVSRYAAHRCNICGHVGMRTNMLKHFKNRHPDLAQHYREWIRPEQEQSVELEVATIPELVPTERPHSFAMHEDGAGYSTDDFWLPVVHQLATPDGVVPVEAMAALGRFRDDVALMLHAVTHLQPSKRRR